MKGRDPSSQSSVMQCVRPCDLRGMSFYNNQVMPTIIVNKQMCKETQNRTSAITVNSDTSMNLLLQKMLRKRNQNC